jgi:hypothetical protein
MKHAAPPSDSTAMNSAGRPLDGRNILVMKPVQIKPELFER